MASACVNNSPAIPWPTPTIPPFNSSTSPPPLEPDISPSERHDTPDFEFRLDVPVGMLPADELFSDGKLVPLQMKASESSSSMPEIIPSSPDPEIPVSELCLVSPKAPRCSRKWREILGLKKQQLQNPRSEEKQRTPNPRSFRHFLNRKPTADSSSLSLPLLRESDTDSSSSRFSLSSTSSSSCCDSSSSSDLLARHSLDTKPTQIPLRVGASHRVGATARVRVSRPVRRVSADAESPRMNSCGKVVFNGGSLERSSSSPGSFNGRPRVRPRGMERSYSANVVRVNPVLNMPVCTLRGSGKPGSVFGFFSSDKRKEKEGSGGKATAGSNNVKIKSEKAVGKSPELNEEKI